MNVTQLKKEIVSHVESSEDEDTLLAIRGLLKSEDQYFALSDFLKKKLNKAIIEESKGNTIPHDEAMRELESWMKDQ